MKSTCYHSITQNVYSNQKSVSNKLLNMQSVIKVNKLTHQYVCPVPDTVVVGEGGLILWIGMIIILINIDIGIGDL